jgi:hypothetical protein
MTLTPYKKIKLSRNPYKKQHPFVEVEQFKFETLLQELSLSFTGKAELNFGICITNQSEVAQRFVLFYLKPIFLDLETIVINGNQSLAWEPTTTEHGFPSLMIPAF